MIIDANDKKSEEINVVCRYRNQILDNVTFINTDRGIIEITPKDQEGNFIVGINGYLKAYIFSDEFDVIPKDSLNKE